MAPTDDSKEQWMREDARLYLQIRNSIDSEDRSLTAHFMEFKKTYEELNMLLPFSADIKVQQTQREQMAVMGFLASLPSEFDTTKSQILSSFEISSLQDTFNRLLRTKIFPSIQMSNALVSKNSNYEPVKQQTKSSGSALEPPGQSSRGVVCYYCHKPGHTRRECRKLLNQNRRFQFAHVVFASNTLERSVVLSADEYAMLLKPASTPTTTLAESGKPDICRMSSSSNKAIDSGATDHMTGRSVAFPGHPLGSGLTPDAAKELGLRAGTPVGTSLIDAHAGGVGVMESVAVPDPEAKEYDKEAICHRLVLVCGTSTCHMAVSCSKLFIPGVWGPFWSAMVPDYWLTEGGQSATGALLDYIIENHVASPRLANRAASQNISVFELLNKILESMVQDLNSPFLAALTEDIHVLPDFHGNRSPIADPKAKGVVCGLTLDTSEKQLALLYLATVQGIAYGTRHIVEHCNAHGHRIDTLLACGGLSKNPLFLQEHADIVGCSIVLPRESESVLLGAAILGAVASKKKYSSLSDAMKALNAAGQVIHPAKDPKVKKYHDAKYQIFRELYEQQLSHRSIMAQALA